MNLENFIVRPRRIYADHFLSFLEGCALPYIVVAPLSQSLSS
jgi:hypothetical protein